ncbi:hypothetical protein TD95_000373 [Thielaviopsis punctulata]|uniref:Uncharacterized protein n=1 Tax=Thielaviopsis punctulata TaxID=72032 RepID=A0A0F4Z9H0_9PEZI|nr:hypothetical protein TD95_000373 [Thielaviopsis punctulata]
MMFYTSVFLFFLLIAIALYLTRVYWLPMLAQLSFSFPGSAHLYQALPTSFQGDLEAGLSSSTFDLAGNISGGDARAGLDEQGKAAVLKIMKKRRLPFDEARKVFMEQRFRDNGIGADGLPKDPKFVSFS